MSTVSMHVIRRMLNELPYPQLIIEDFKSRGINRVTTDNMHVIYSMLELRKWYYEFVTGNIQLLDPGDSGVILGIGNTLWGKAIYANKSSQTNQANR